MHAQNATVALVHAFPGADGANPASSLIELPNGKLLGMTWSSHPSLKGGTIFTIDTNGVLQTKYKFASDSSQCAAEAYSPTDNGLLQASDGNFYGVCYGGGQFGGGTIYTFNPTGNFRVLHSFGGTDGLYPIGPLVEGADQNF